MSDKGGVINASAAELYHDLSSFGWFEEPLLPSRASVADKRPMPAMNAMPATAEDFERLLHQRVSIREFADEPLSPADLEYLLRCGYGRVPGAVSRRTVPSAGGMFPLTLVAVVQNVHATTAGWYRLDASDNMVNRLGLPHHNNVASLFRTLHVDFSRAAAVIFILGSISTLQQRYGERGYRYLLLEAGHVAQNVLLSAAAVDVAAVPLGGFDDAAVNALIQPEIPDAVTLYSITVGRAPK